MPIYAYKCASCGLAKDVLQKMSDPPLDRCPACGEPTFLKQVTAAGFQLKGSGWYATDFKSQPKAAGSASAKDDAADSKGSESNGDSVKSERKSDDKPAANTEAKSESKSPPAPAASPAPAAPAAPKPSGSKPPAGG